MPDADNQSVPKKTEHSRPGIRTMISDVQEYAQSKKFSLAELAARRKYEPEGLSRAAGFNLKLWVYVLFAVLVLATGGFGAYRFAQKSEAPSEIAGIAEPKPIISAGRETTIELAGFDRKKFLEDWKKLFALQLLPREFLYVKIFDSAGLKFLEGRNFFELAGILPPSIFLDGLNARATLGIMDTSRGNEPVFIFEIENYSSAFAGLLQWEEKMPADFMAILMPDIAYGRGENVFQDTVVANNDARFIKNTLGENMLGYSIFNRKFLIISQSPQAVEAVIRQMSALPPR